MNDRQKDAGGEAVQIRRLASEGERRVETYEDAGRGRDVEREAQHQGVDMKRCLEEDDNDGGDDDDDDKKGPDETARIQITG